MALAMDGEHVVALTVGVVVIVIEAEGHQPIASRPAEEEAVVSMAESLEQGSLAGAEL